MAVLKCKMCGGDLNITADETVVECEYCGSKQTVPTADNEKKMNLFARANRLLRNCEFDKAAGIYESIVAEFPEEAEAYWGLVLCKYGIEYVDDPATGNKVPTCHRSSFDSVMDDKDFELVMEYADGIARRVYREQAKQIEELRKAIIEVSGKEEPYDIFISYKETDDSDERTLDSVIAQDIYTELTGKGYRVFFSRISLEDKLGTEYEPYIFAALNSAKVMLVVGTDYDYFNAVWVKNEWSRFLALIAKGEKKTLIPVFKNIDAYDMPKEFAKLSAQDMGKVGAMQDLLRGVDKILGKTAQPAAAPSPVQPQTVIQQVVGGSNFDALIQRGYMSLEDAIFGEAQGFFNDALNIDAKSAEAYLGLFMAQITANNKYRAEKVFVAGDYTKNRYYQRAKQFAEGTLKAELEDWEKKRSDRLAKEAEEARRARAAAEEAERKRRAEAEEKEKRRPQEIAYIREQLKAGNFVMTDEQRAEQERLNKEAEQAKKAAEKAEAEYTAMPEYTEKLRLEKEIADKRTYMSGLGIFKGKEKKQTQEQIAQLETELNAVEQKLAPAKKSAEDSSAIAIAQAEAVAAYGEKANSEARKQLQKKLLEVSKLSNGNVIFGSYTQTKEGKDKTPIEWRVLDKQENRILIISEKALDHQPYNTSYEAITWEKCSLRTWLNSTFLKNAFSVDEQAMIAVTNVSADKNPENSTDPGKATNDKVFLLSTAEAEKYFMTDASRRCAPTAYAKAQGADTYDSYKTASGEASCYWLLRSPGFLQSAAASVNDAGSVYYDGIFVSYRAAVRPALWIDLDS